VKVLLICGFLGAGKTTLLRNVLEKADSRTAVLVNDAGKLGIDAGLARKRGGLDVFEMAGGCICCTLKGDMVETLARIASTIKPERLIIEPSGIAAPSDLIRVFHIPPVSRLCELEAVIGVVDSKTFRRFYESGKIGLFFTDQIQNADVVLLNKIDLIDEEELQRCHEIVRQLNPVGVVLPTQHCKVELPAGLRRGKFHGLDYSIAFDTVAVHLDHQFGAEEIASLFEELRAGRYGEVLRAKAVVPTPTGPQYVDLAGDEIQSRPYDGDATSGRFVAIGVHLHQAALRERLGVPQHDGEHTHLH